MITVLFDFRSYQLSKNRGIGRYFLSLFNSIIDTGVVSPSILVSNCNEIHLPDAVTRSGPVYLLENWDAYCIEEKFDFFFRGNFFDLHDDVFNYEFPDKVISKCNNIVGILHDLIPMIFSGNYLNTDDARWIYAKHVEALTLPYHFFANSLCTKNDCIKLAGISPEKISVIYGGADLDKFKSDFSNKPYKIQDRTNNIIFVPGEDLRKNFTGAAYAFAIAYSSGKIPRSSKLYLICKSSKWFNECIAKELDKFSVNIKNRIVVTGYISDEEMVELIGSARATIFPSLYEGLGLPIIESYVAGTPSFASNISATKEFVAEDCSFNPYSDTELSRLIIKIYNDEEYCKKSLEFGRKLLNKVNWENSAKIVVNKLTEIKKQEHRQNKVAVFSCLPPEKTGIAGYSYICHTSEPQLYDLIGEIKSLSHLNELQNSPVIYKFNANRLSYKNCVKLENNSIICENIYDDSPVCWGPYITLEKGQYELNISYKLTNSKSYYRVTGECGSQVFAKGCLDASKSSQRLQFNLESSINDIEVQIFFSGTGRLEVRNITFTKIRKSDRIYNNIIPAVIYNYMHLYRNYSSKLYIFGNSEHHQFSLAQAIKSKGESRRFLYLHEAFILFCFYPILNFDLNKVKKFLINWYPNLTGEINKISTFSDVYNVARSNNICGIRPLINMTGIKNIIVNNSRAKKLIFDELSKVEAKSLSVNILYHPIPKLENIPLAKDIIHPDYKIIGSFGILSESKNTDQIIIAVDELNRRGHNIKLLLAGYNVDWYIKDHNINTKNLILENEPSEERLISLMNSVDMAVQLRKNPHGESSGCIAQLLGLNKKIVSTEGFVSDEFASYCTLVPEDVTIEELKTAIVATLQKDPIINNLSDKYGYNNLAKDLYQICVSSQT